MSTSIKAENGALFIVGSIGVDVVRTDGQEGIYARLTPEQRRQLAAALNPDRGGQWTRADLPEHDAIRDVDDMYGNGMRSKVINLALDAVVAHLNANRPKPVTTTADLATAERWKSAFKAADEALRQAERERDDLRRQVADLAERRRKHADERAAWTRNRRELADERDEAYRVCNDRDDLYVDLQKVRDSRDAAVARADELARLLRKTGELEQVRPAGTVTRSELAEAIRQGWGLGSPHAVLDAVDELVSGDDPAVHVVRESDISAAEVGQDEYGNWSTERTSWAPGINAEQVRAGTSSYLEVLAQREALARRVETETAVDPIEARALELWETAHPGTAPIASVMDTLRALARDQVGQGAEQ